MSEEKKVYEIGYLLNPAMSEEDVLGEVAKIKSVLEKQGAIFLSGDVPVLIDLAYPISKMFEADKQIFEKAFFAWIKFEAPSDNAEIIKKELENLQDILRFLLIKSLALDTLVSETKKVIKKEIVLVDEEKQKKVNPLKIAKKEESVEEKNDVSDAKNLEEKKDPKKEEIKDEDLDETIDKLII